MGPYLWVAVGSALGGMARHWCTEAVLARFTDPFPLGTVLINILGSFVIGFFGTLTAPNGLVPIGLEGRLFVMVGICGGYTTFSSFSLQTLMLMQSGDWARASLNVLLSVALCLVAVGLGVAAASALNALRGA